jgi:hypothetical protein
MVWVWISLLGLAALVPRVEATHEVDHRYLVLGYVRDGAGQPIRGAHVRLIREATGLSYEATTGSDGFYLLVVHLHHDDDVGDALRISVGRATARLEARFAPWDANSHRGAMVDFRGTQAQERPDLFAAALAEYLKP